MNSIIPRRISHHLGAALATLLVAAITAFLQSAPQGPATTDPPTFTGEVKTIIGPSGTPRVTYTWEASEIPHAIDIALYCFDGDAVSVTFRTLFAHNDTQGTFSFGLNLDLENIYNARITAEFDDPAQTEVVDLVAF